MPAPDRRPARNGIRNSDPAEARRVFGLCGLTVPFRNKTPVAPNASGSPRDRPRVAGDLQAIEHYYQRMSAE